jgi:hypothetical protein
MTRMLIESRIRQEFAHARQNLIERGWGVNGAAMVARSYVEQSTEGWLRSADMKELEASIATRRNELMAGEFDMLNLNPPAAVAPEVTVEASTDVPRADEMDMQVAARLNEQQLQSIAPSIEGPRSAQPVAVPKDQAVQPVTKTAEPAKSDSANWGTALAVMGAAQQVVGQFYALKSQQTQLKQQALSLEFQERMSQINARSAERQAADMIAAGRQQAMELTMRAGQVREGAKATMGARGIRADVGSGAETIASIELMKEVDRFTIDANAVRAANAARMQGVNAANEGLLAGTSAYSLRMQAGALNPVAGAMPSLLTGAGQYLSQRAADRRWAAWAASQGLGE